MMKIQILRIRTFVPIRMKMAVMTVHSDTIIQQMMVQILIVMVSVMMEIPMMIMTVSMIMKMTMMIMTV